MAHITLKREGDSEPEETFIDRYVEYGWTVTDAPRQYHVAGGAIILSAIMCPHVVLAAQHNPKIRPNLWAMILAGTTVTRKSTSMNLAISTLAEVMPREDFMLGNDGSQEGILTELQQRDGKASVFHRDEITGFIEAAVKKDYMAGLLQSLTGLYDGQPDKRTLRSGTINVEKPRLIIWCGGIKTQMQEIVSVEHIRSGFLPRFIVVSGTTSSDQLRPIGPPMDVDPTEDVKAKIIEELYQITNFWTPKPTVKTLTLGGTTTQRTVQQGERTMTATPEAWKRMAHLTFDAVKMGENAADPVIYTPMYTRLADSIIKIAILLAGARKSLTIEFNDVCQAIRLGNLFLESATDFAHGVEEAPDINPWEKKCDKILGYIKSQSKKNKTVTRTEVMRQFHVRSKDVPDVETTLVQRGQIKISVRKGMMPNGNKSSRERVEYWLVEGNERPVDDTLSVPIGRFRKETPYS